MQIILLRNDGKFSIKLVLFLFVLISTQCYADEAKIAKDVQRRGQQQSQIDNNLEKGQNLEATTNDITPESDEILSPIQTPADEGKTSVETVTETVPTQDDTTNDLGDAPIEENTSTEKTLTDTKSTEDVDNPTNLVESEQNLPTKDRVNLLPEEQSAGGVYGKQVAHVPGNRISTPHTTSSQSPLGGIASIFGGFRRLTAGGAAANLAGGGTDPEVERAQKLKSGFEKMIQLVNILGQVDSFLSDRTRSVVRRISLLADSDSDDRYRRSSHHRRHHY